MSAQAKFITIEGIEGVGKSSNVQFLVRRLQRSGIDVLTTREPGGTKAAEAIREILLSSDNETLLAKTELLLLYAARIQHVEHVIRPALANHQWVICDRFVDATYAYQGAGRQMPTEEIDIIDQWALNGFKPDVTIVLDAPVDVAMARIKPQRALDRFEQESEDFFHRIRLAYLDRARAEPNRYRIIDASQSMEDVQKQLSTIVQQILGK